MNLPSVLVHRITPRKNTLGGAYFHSMNPIPALRWSIGAKVTTTGVKVAFGGQTPASIEINLQEPEAEALIEILTHALTLRRDAEVQVKEAA